MKVRTSFCQLQRFLWTIFLSAGLYLLGWPPVVCAADQDNGRRHSLIHRPTTSTAPPIASTQGTIVSGVGQPRSRILESPARLQASSASEPTTPSPHHKLTKRPRVATVTPIPFPPTTQPLVTKPKAVPSSTSLSTGTFVGSAGISEGTIVKSSSPFQGLASTAVAPAATRTSPAPSLLASAVNASTSSLASTSSGPSTTPTTSGSRSAVNLLQNPAIASLLQPPAPIVTSPPSQSPSPTPSPSTSSSPPSPSATTGSAILSWSSNREPDLAGYKVYVGTQSGLYTFPGSPVTVGTVNSYTITNLPSGQTYFFALSAYNNAGYESLLSAEVSKSIY